MSITTLSSREFNHDIGRAKKAAANGPVVITDRGAPAHVLLTFEDYRKLRGDRLTLADALDKMEALDFEFDPPKSGGPAAQAVEFD
jgi:prevent-host-death family protein